MSESRFGGFVDRVTAEDEELLRLQGDAERGIPGALELNALTTGDVEIELDDDGGVTVDFDPSEGDEEDGDFYRNLAEDVDDRELGSLSSDLMSQYDSNKASRSDWEDSYSKGLELLGFNYEERTMPFRGASGVTHPLLAEAAIQFQAQAFNELLPPDGPVKTQVFGDTSSGQVQQANRVKEFMNYYIMNVMKEYTPDFDQMLFYLPLAGSTFKKVYYDEVLERAVSKFVPAENLVVPYETSDLDSCPIIAQVLRMPFNELRKKQVAGFYRDIPVLPSQGNNDLGGAQEEYDKIQGTSSSQIDYDCTLIEFHVDLDLEGFEELDEDGEPTGIKVPYIVTVSEDSGVILSIRRNFVEDDPKREKIQYFVHYKFLPGFGFYGLGLIHSIGGLSRTATAALRQLIDAGTFSNLPAGFKARGLRVRNEDEPLQPGEFRDVDAPGGVLRDSLMPLPFKGPDATLFQLLGFVVDAGRRFATITDMKVGDGNQQAAVGTTIAMLEQGSRVMSAVHKRLHYAMREEFKLLARIMSEYLPSEYPYMVSGAERSVKQEDFDDRIDVIPVSDPNVFSQSQRIALAQAELQLATQAPELHDMHEAYRRMYYALGVRDVDKILKPRAEETLIPKDPAQENIDALDSAILKAYEGQAHDAHIQAHLTFATSPLVAQMPMVGVNLLKHVLEHVKLKAQEQAVIQFLQQTGGEPASEEQMLELEALESQLIAQGMVEMKQLSAQLSGIGQNQGPDPLVQLKEQELQLKAQEAQQDAQQDQAELALQREKAQIKAQEFQQRLQSQESQNQQRLQASLQRELLKQEFQRQQAALKGD
jgi:hypothetical protein